MIFKGKKYVDIFNIEKCVFNKTVPLSKAYSVWSWERLLSQIKWFFVHLFHSIPGVGFQIVLGIVRQHVGLRDWPVQDIIVPGIHSLRVPICQWITYRSRRIVLREPIPAGDCMNSFSIHGLSAISYFQIEAVVLVWRWNVGRHDLALAIWEPADYANFVYITVYTPLDSRVFSSSLGVLSSSKKIFQKICCFFFTINITLI